MCVSITVEVPEGFESLHVKVMKVVRNSGARKAGVHCQMYLKSLSLSLTEVPITFADTVIIGTNACRKSVTQGTRKTPDVDPWQPNQDHCIDMDAVIGSVDTILSKALLHNKFVRAELVEYIE